jgi:hypothetical protein
MKRSPLVLAVLLTLVAPPASAQGPKREFVIEQTRAMSITRDVLVRQGYEVVRVQNVRNDRIVYYRRGNMGRGKGKGPLMKLIIRRTANRVIFVETPNAVLVDINVRLRS